MEIKVREVGVEEKSVQQVEQELLDKHEAQHNEEVNPQVDETKEEVNLKVDEQVEEDSKPQPMSEEDVLSFIKNKYNKEITSVDDLFQARQESEPLPEDVSAYLKYKKETGRGFDDFVKLNKNLDEEKPEALLREYLRATEKGLDDDDINMMGSVCAS